jgi:hypothetical protein
MGALSNLEILEKVIDDNLEDIFEVYLKEAKRKRKR